MRFRKQLVPLLLLTINCSAGGTEPTGACAGPQNYSIGSTASGAIGVDDCKGAAGNFGDIYQMTLTAQSRFSVTVTPSGFNAGVSLFAGLPSAAANATLVYEEVGSGPVGANAFLPPGSYFLFVESNNGKTGNYKLESQTAAAEGCGAYANWTYPGVELAGVVTTNDCAGNEPARQDIYELWLKKGQSVSVSATLNKIGAVLWRTGSASSANLITKNLNSGGSTAFTFTAPSDDAYRLHVIGEPGTVGVISYTASIK